RAPSSASVAKTPRPRAVRRSGVAAGRCRDALARAEAGRAASADPACAGWRRAELGATGLGITGLGAVSGGAAAGLGGMTGAAGAAGTALRWRRRAGTRIAGAGKATALMVIVSSHLHRTPVRRTCVLNVARRSEEHTSELQSRFDLVCRLLLEK